MKNKIVCLGVLLLLVIACNLPGQTNSTVLPPAPTRVNSATDVPAPVVLLSDTPIKPEPTQIIPPTSTPTSLPPTPTITPTPIPSDIPFTIDCSTLPSDRKSDCDAFITVTRDQVYPILRDVTGVSLSKCYQNIQYIILPTDPGPGVGQGNGKNKIVINQAYSIDIRHKYDVQELLHSISACGRALNDDVFDGMLKNYVYDRLGVHDAGYFTSQTSDDLTKNLDFLYSKAKTASGADLGDACRGIFQRKMTGLYFDLGDKDIFTDLYRGTIIPVKISRQPNSIITASWGPEAKQVEEILEMLKNKYQKSMDVPECGY